MTLIEQVGTFLQAQGLGTIGTNIFLSYSVNLPDACICVLDTGGNKPDVDLPLKSPTFQVFIRSTTYEAGKTILDSVRSLLHGKFTQTQNNGTLVSGQTFILTLFAQSEGGHLGRDDAGRDTFSINFYAKTR